MNFKLRGSNSTEQMDINRKIGRLGEHIAKDDYRNLGYHILDVKSGMFCDFVAMRFLDNKLDLVFVECKVGNAQMSRRQIWFKRWCQKAGQNFFLYRISNERLRYLMENEIGVGDLR